MRQRPVAGRLPAVDEHDARPGAPPRAGMNQAGRSTAVGVDEHRLERQAEVGRRDPRRRGGAGSRRGPDRPARSGRPARAGPARDRGGDPARREGSHASRGRHPARAVKSGRGRASAPRPTLGDGQA